MPLTNYLRIRVGHREVEVEQNKDLPIAIDYALEDADNFEQKKGSSAFDVTIPATLNNSQTYNTPHNPAVEDLTADEFFSAPQPCVIEANGVELLAGKAFLKQATHTDRPQQITINCYGNNADWVIDLKETTLLDCVNPAIHAFTYINIQNSWAFNGRSESADFVYAPVRYRKPFLTRGNDADMIVTPFELKPAISIYWLIYRAFKSIGYQLQSNFLDSDYFRRLVMPWTWGSFLFTDETLFAPFKFRAMCTRQELQNGATGGYDDDVSPNSGTTVTQKMLWADVSSGGALGGFQGTPGLYHGVGMAAPYGTNASDLNYYYPASSVLGPVAMGFELSTYYYVFAGGGTNSWGLYCQWYITTAGGIVTLVAEDLMYQYNGNGLSEGTATISREITINPGDIVTARMHIRASASAFSLNWKVGQPYPTSTGSSFPASYFRNTYIKKALGSPVNFKLYPNFKNYKILDLLRGVIDCFNLSMNTDPVTKTVFMEPTYPWSPDNNPTNLQPGYFVRQRIDWTSKQDLSQESIVELYSDNEREFDFKFKEDNNDGGLQVLNKRYAINAGDSRYLFPERFKTGNKEYRNRFFSPVVHIQMQQWGGVTNVLPQLIALVPENIANTSQAEDENAFQPKLAYYKGLVSNAGGWVWQPDPTNPAAITSMLTLPFMFAVNYHSGGENDPVLTYSDQLISGSGSTAVIGRGLMRRFFLQRLAIMRHGKRYTTWMHLDMKDITNWQHREAIIIGNSIYYLIGVQKFKPLTDQSTQVVLWKYSPVMQADSDNCFPSLSSVANATATLPSSDLKYAQLLILSTDLPQ